MKQDKDYNPNPKSPSKFDDLYNSTTEEEEDDDIERATDNQNDTLKPSGGTFRRKHKIVRKTITSKGTADGAYLLTN